ncbi:MAG: GAF domain-containing protein, partial [Thermoplasmata archaeon]|nr:GAF domain-containing protein [Thermoplasmata archaeon]NIY01990.1 GAF domain-containing protein [Thermoplasmata archaeon]
MTALQTGAGGGSGIIVINRDISKLVPLRMELERQSEELAVRDEILRILSRSPGFEVGLGEALERIIQIAGFDCGGIGLVEGDRGTLVPQVQCGIPEALRRDWQREPLRLDEDLIRPVMERGEPLIIEDLAHDPRVARPALKESGLRTAVIVPIQVQKRIVGSLFLLDRRPLELPLEGLRLLQAVSDQMGVAVENAELYRELEKRVEQRTEALRTSQERLQALSQVSAKIQGVLDEERIIALAMEELAQMGFRGSFWSVEEGGKAVVRRYSSLPPQIVAAWRKATKADPKLSRISPAEVPHLREAIEQGELVVITDLEKT